MTPKLLATQLRDRFHVVGDDQTVIDLVARSIANCRSKFDNAIIATMPTRFDTEIEAVIARIETSDEFIRYCENPLLFHGDEINLIRDDLVQVRTLQKDRYFRVPRKVQKLIAARDKVVEDCTTPRLGDDYIAAAEALDKPVHKFAEKHGFNFISLSGL